MTPEERFERIEKTLDRITTESEIAYAKSEIRFAKIEKTLDRVDEDLEILAHNVLKLSEFQKETGERLNILIGVVERYFSNGENK